MTDRLHELLPWYLNATLGPEEKEAFERHLAVCEACRKERDLLLKLQAEVALQGESFLADHPTPDKLVALVAPAAAEKPLGEPEAAQLRQHLALCATCAEEARWLRGEAAAGPALPERRLASRIARPTRRIWPWASAALLLLALGVVPLWVRRPPPGSATATPRLAFVNPTERAGGEPSEVEVEPGAPAIHLLFPVDLAPDAFPAVLEILGPDRRLLYRRDDIVASDLYRGAYLLVVCRRDEYPDGDYLARVRGSGRHSGLVIDYPFRIRSAQR